MDSRNPWLRLSVVLFLALLARVACGESQSSRKSNSKASRSLSSSPDVNRETIDLRSSSPMDFWVGPGFAFFRSEAGFAINLGANIPLPVELPIFVGIDAGINFWSHDYGVSVFNNGPSENWTNIQLLPSVYYRIDLPKPRILHPYVGFSMGPSIFVAKANSGGPAATQTSVSATKVYFEVLFRPGISVDLSANIAVNAESKVGILGGDFIYLPQAALSFVL